LDIDQGLLTQFQQLPNLLHFGINMVALQSFVRESSFYIGAGESLDPNFRGFAAPYMFHLAEPNYAPKILAFFIAAGIFSVFGTHTSRAFRLMRTMRHAPDIKALSKARKTIRPSLRASGAIYGTVALTALAVPDAEVQLFFLPFLTLPIEWGVAGLVAMDITGIVRAWRTLDHYGRLSGAAFGVAYFFARPYVWARTANPLSSDNVPRNP
jgi:rhomboid-like protein